MKICLGAGWGVVEEWEDGLTELRAGERNFTRNLNHHYKSNCRHFESPFVIPSIHPCHNNSQTYHRTLLSFQLYANEDAMMKMTTMMTRTITRPRFEVSPCTLLLCRGKKYIMPKGMMISRLLDNGILIWEILKVKELIIVALYECRVFGQKTNYYRTSRRRVIPPITIIIEAIIIHLGLSGWLRERRSVNNMIGFPQPTNMTAKLFAVWSSPSMFVAISINSYSFK